MKKRINVPDINCTIVFNADGQEIIKTTSNNESLSGPNTTGTQDQDMSGRVYVDSNGLGLIKGNINSK